MKMNSLLKSKPKSNTKKVFFITVVSCISVVLLQFLFPHLLMTAVGTVAQPLWYVRDKTSENVGGFFGYFKSVGSLRTENEKLRNDLYLLRIKESEFNQMKIQYDALKVLVNATSTSHTQVGRVISKPPFTPYDIFVVDKGSNDGLLTGDLVYVNDGLVIGYISTLMPETASVTLFSSGGEAHEFEVSRTGVAIEVVGKGGGNFEVSVPKDFDIEVGDTLRKPLSNQSIAATVYSVDVSSQNSFKRVYARIPQAIFQSTVVIIGDL